MMKSSQKKSQNYIPFLQSIYPEMQRKTSSGGQGACVPGPGGRGGSSRTPERHATPAHGGQWELWPRGRPARTTLSPGWQGVPAARQRGACVTGPRWANGSSRTPERRGTPAPGGQLELWPCARPARVTLAPCQQGGLRPRIRALTCPRPPVGRGGSGRAPEPRASPQPPDILLGIYIP